MEKQTQFRDVKTAGATTFKNTSPEQAIFRKEGGRRQHARLSVRLIKV
jgi:hypothetical protein